MEIVETLIGDTVKFTYVDSGTTFSPITFKLYDGSESVVNSGTLASSGNGHYYRNEVMPNTPGLYVGEMVGWVNSYPYPRRVGVRLMTEEVD